MKAIDIPLLSPEDIEVKVKQIGGKGALALLYKTARTDMEYLDSVFGMGNWQCDYREIKGNLYCTISIWDDEKAQWVSKVDCGIESREDGEGNEKKGEASDAFKRAGFKIGIGRELYSSPFIWLSVETEQDKNGKWQLKDRFAKFEVTDIGYDNRRKINKLVIANEKTGEVVYRYGSDTQKKEPEKKSAKQNAPKQDKDAQKANLATTTAKVPEQAKADNDAKVLLESFLKSHGIDRKQFAFMRTQAIKDKKLPDKAFDQFTMEDWIKLFAGMESLYLQGYFPIKADVA